jgi:hypothetical protein
MFPMNPTQRVCAAAAFASMAWLIGSAQAIGDPDVGRALPVAISLNDAVALSTNDVWAVGDGTDPQDPDNSDPAFEHWNGSRWTLAPTERSLEDAEAIFAVSAVASADAWAVGSTGQPSFNDRQIEILHWDGSRWSFVAPVQASFNNELFGVAAVAADDVWAVGGLSTGGTGLNRALVEHWDGTSWSVASIPDPSGTESLSRVEAVSARDVWAVGTRSPAFAPARPFAMHWNGFTWSIVPVPTVRGKTTILNDLAVVSTNDVWAAGSSFNSSIPSLSSTLTEHWDGTRWNIVKSADTGGDNADELTAVASIASNDIWTVSTYVDNGEKTLTEHWDGSRWTIVPAPPAFTINGAAAAASEDVWAVGWNISHSVIEHWDGSAWSRVPSP